MELIAAQYRGRARVLQAKLFVQIYGGGITPLLNSEGKVVISKRKY
ncbi:MAG: hypothetical protein IIT46_08090 [Lachnospiraceae bacterium]|nr:hypothetical protein [Lachnospiraceae bacterium]